MKSAINKQATEKKQAKRKRIAYVLAYVVAGVFVLAALIMNLIVYTEEGWFGFNIIASAVMAAGITFICATISNFFFNYAEINGYEEALSPVYEQTHQIAKDLKNVFEAQLSIVPTGVRQVEINKQKSSDDFMELLKDAVSIDMCFLTGATLFLNQQDAIIKAIEAGAKLRVLVSDITSPVFVNPDECYASIRKGLCPGVDLKHNAEQALRLLKVTIVDRVSKNKESVEVGLASCIVTANNIIVKKSDGSGMIYCTPYIPYQHSQKTFRFTLTPENSRGYQLINKSFDEMWSSRIPAQISSSRANGHETISLEIDKAGMLSVIDLSEPKSIEVATND
jgi:hypothetical protein